MQQGTQPQRRSPFAILLFALGIMMTVGGISILVLGGGIPVYLSFMFVGSTLLINASAVQLGTRRHNQVLTELQEIRSHLSPSANNV